MKEILGGILGLFIAVACFVFLFILILGGFGSCAKEGLDLAATVTPSTFVRVTWESSTGGTKKMTVHNYATKELKMRVDYETKGFLWMKSNKSLDISLKAGYMYTLPQKFDPGDRYSILVDGASDPITGTVP